MLAFLSIALNDVMMTMHHICDAGDLMECIPNGRECLLEDQSREGCVVFFVCLVKYKFLNRLSSILPLQYSSF